MEQQLDPMNVKKNRKRAGLSQWSVASAIGKSQGWLSNIEQGYVSPSQKVLEDIFRAIEKLDIERN